ncbi:MAG: ABC transporter ATP-binding protein, partial [Firmicutes bacterium]|nr:ABC transporter ATP-binding protein [Bacillota bacterium]
MRAVEGVDLAVFPGEVVVLVGPDGAGKTTLARLAAGVLAPTAGRVVPDPRGRVGYLAARFSLYPDLTVWENLAFFGRLYGMATRDVEAEGTRLLEWVGLLPFRDRLAGALSGGMRQKLALACALLHRPPVLVLDEPTTGVDPVARAEFWQLLREEARAGRAVLVTTSYLDVAVGCDRVALLWWPRAPRRSCGGSTARAAGWTGCSSTWPGAGENGPGAGANRKKGSGPGRCPGRVL